MKKTIVILTLLLLPQLAFAYIPRFWMIMSRTAENNGRGIYKVVQNVTFLHQSEPLLLRESWIIKNGDQMRVTVTGLGPLKDKVHFTLVFDGKRRYFQGSDKKVRYLKMSEDWFETYFHFRFSKNIKSKMFEQKMITASGLTLPPAYRPTKKGEEKPVAFDQEFLRLGRVNGKVAYAIGTPTPPDSATPKPGLWIEQDQFRLLKLRLKNEVEVTATNHLKYGRNLNLARLREVHWGENKVEIHTISVKPLYASSAIKKLFKPTSLSDLKEEQKPLKREDDPVLYEFYQRFR